MINITRLANGALLIQKDGADILIDTAAIGSALPVVLGSLLENSRAIGAARLEGYEAGLIVGHANGQRELEAKYQKEAEQLAEGLALLNVRAPLAA